MAMRGLLGKRRGERVSPHAEMDLSTAEGTNELITYLVVRFVLVMVAVMASEGLVVWFESRRLVPLLEGMAAGVSIAVPQDTNGLVALLRWVGLLVASIVQGNYLQAVGLARGSFVLLLTLLMLAMLVLPPLCGLLGIQMAQPVSDLLSFALSFVVARGILRQLAGMEDKQTA